MNSLPRLRKKRFFKELPFVLASLVPGRTPVLRSLLRMVRSLEIEQ